MVKRFFNTLQSHQANSNTKQLIILENMKFFEIVTLFAGFSAAAPGLNRRVNPSGQEVTIASLDYTGTGCPAGSLTSTLSSDSPTSTLSSGSAGLILAYTQFMVFTDSFSPDDSHEACVVKINLQTPPGCQFSISRGDYNGHVRLAPGSTGTIHTDYDDSGGSQKVPKLSKDI
jgi:hypothetical protein